MTGPGLAGGSFLDFLEVRDTMSYIPGKEDNSYLIQEMYIISLYNLYFVFQMF